MYKVLAWVLIALCSVSSVAQQGAALPKRAVAIKQKVASLPTDARISVIPVDGEEAHGKLVSKDEDGFTFYNVDQKANQTQRYLDVKKVKEGYGGYNSVRGRHTDHTKAVVITLVVVGFSALSSELRQRPNSSCSISESRHGPGAMRSARLESRSSWRLMRYRVKFIQPPR